MWDRSWLEILWQNVRQAVRTLRNDPGFTLVALTAITIGIGANTSIFSVVDKVLLQPLPYRDPDSIVQLGRRFPVGVSYTASIPKYMVWRDNDVFSSMALYDLEGPGFNIDNGDFPEQVKGAHVSAGYFTVFGVSPLIGRAFNQAEDLPNGPKAALISENLWRSHFGFDAQILTRTINLNSLPYPIVGIIGVCADTRYDTLRNNPPPMHFGLYRQQPEVDGLTYIVRTPMKAEAIVPSLRAAVQRIDPNLPLLDIRTQRQQIDADLQQERIFASLSTGFGLLALSLACVGIYGIMAYTVAQRTNEIGIRLALGARRGQVRGIVLRESGWLALAGVAIGGSVALGLGRLVESLLYRVKATDPLSVLGAALLLLAVALSSGWIPARRASRLEPMDALRHE
jgi:MacB-like periplasmic core domain/FtsX-like permease family